jgi:dihydrofolate synthase/folylpolyglutamate synthase
MQFWDKNIIIDGAHNPSAAKSLRDTLDKISQNKDRVWFFGALKNKDFDKSIKFLFKKEDIVYFVKFNSPNSCGEEEFQKYLTDDKRSMIDISNVLDIINRQKNGQKLSIICGSLYLAGELLAQLDD